MVRFEIVERNSDHENKCRTVCRTLCRSRSGTQLDRPFDLRCPSPIVSSITPSTRPSKSLIACSNSTRSNRRKHNNESRLHSPFCTRPQYQFPESNWTLLTFQDSLVHNNRRLFFGSCSSHWSRPWSCTRPRSADVSARSRLFVSPHTHQDMCRDWSAHDAWTTSCRNG